MDDQYDDLDDDDGYEDNEYNYDDNKYDPYKFYFKFDVGNTPLTDWLQNMINDIVNNPFGINYIPGFPFKKFPVNSWNPNTAKQEGFQYLGSNYQGNPIWKKQYFAIDKINIEHKMHLQNHAKHFVSQPTHYKGLFDILN